MGTEYEAFIRKLKKNLENSLIPMREKLSILEYLLHHAQVLTTYMKCRHKDAVSVLNEFSLSGSDESEQKITASLGALKKTLSTLEPVLNPLLEQV